MTSLDVIRCKGNKSSFRSLALRAHSRATRSKARLVSKSKGITLDFNRVKEMMRTEPSILYSSMNFLPFISHKTYLSAGTDAIKAFLTVVPQGGSSNAYFRSAIIKLLLPTFHIENFVSLTFQLVSAQIPGDRAKIKRRVNLLPRASSLEIKLSLSWYRLIKIISGGCM